LRRHLVLIAALFTFSTLAVAACGGGGNDDEDQITDAIQTTATTTNDSNCTKFETQRFLDQTEFKSGKAALQECKSSNPENDADSADVSNIDVNGDKATADAALTGSAFGGQTLVISLVKEGDQWKLDYIEDIKNFDVPEFAKAFAVAAQKGDNPLSAAQATCVKDNLATAPPDTLKAAVLSGDPNKLSPAFQGC
jgi:hypothetical protein